jgi:hypothetical protein
MQPGTAIGQRGGNQGPPDPSKWPTRKWWAATVTALGGVLILVIQQGGFTAEVAIALVGVVTQAIVTYLIPNDSTPGGVPLSRPGR